ncbi:MAG TPA: ATP-binding cassette domain-containing protein [Clostridia bacterium]|jgi:NitT/TauT family transport system ATP-binding protein|nr:ATP-binding cassette domain-containing protein [Clostridia bacterium]
MKLVNITKRFGIHTVFSDFNLELKDNSITCFLGPSGSGKTTLLNIIAGLTDFEGKIDINNDKISYIFQTQRLLNNLTVEDNLLYVLKNCGFSKEEISAKISEMLKKVKLEDNKDMYPRQLSGGMAQRVSLARAFVYPGKILLMDEPFKGLDISLKKHIISTFQNLYEKDPKTTVFVTHDLEEALILGDRIIVIGEGGKVIFDEENDKSPEAVLSLRERVYRII